MQPKRVNGCRRAARRFLVHLAAVPAALLLAAPGHAELLPPLDSVALPNERAVLDEMLLKMTEGGLTQWEDMLAAYDGGLAKLREPTKLRGYVQFSRTTALLQLSRHAEAIEAVEESVRLLPDYSGPLILAAWTYGYAGLPGQGADYLIRATHKDPQVFRSIEDYEVHGLLRRLADARDERRRRAVSDRLLEIGWVGSRIGSQSALALNAIKRRMAEGDLEGARSLVPKLLVPDHSRSLLIDNAYRPLWPDIEKWAGPRLRNQWSIYLTQARERWQASKDPETVGDYANALLAADDDQTLIDDVYPLFLNGLDKDAHYQLLFTASRVAAALGRQGRWEDVERLYAAAEAAWPLGEQPNALNIAANHARWLLFRGSTAEALAKMDAVLADARKWGPGVNPRAFVIMHLYRACMLHELGRADEAGVSLATVISQGGPEDAAWVYLCMNDPTAARNALIAGLEEETKRASVLEFVQIDSAPPVKSEFGRRIDERIAALKTDPMLLIEVAKHGRVLPYDISEGASDSSAGLAEASQPSG